VLEREKSVKTPESQERESTALSDRPCRTRRMFLGGLAVATVVSAAAGTVELGPFAKPVGAHEGVSEGRDRARESFEIREQAALEAREISIPTQVTNGDEQRYSHFIGSFSKGLPHNSLGEVDTNAYTLLLNAVRRGATEGFENVPLGGNSKLVNPMAGVAFDLEGTDSHQLAIPPPPALASKQRADDMVELYWMALCRDIHFADYAVNPTAQAAAAELSTLSGFQGPKSGNQVTPQMLFRGFAAEDVLGPYVSQLLLAPFRYGQYLLSGQITTYLSGFDYLENQPEWVQCRNGQGPFPKNKIDSQARYIRNGRDLTAYVHSDQAYEAFYNAAILLSGSGAPPNPGNPYLSLTKQASFATFGAAHFQSLLAEVANRALKAVWYAKWFVHRTLRPEDFGGLVHMTKTGQTSYPLHSDVLNSHAAAQTLSKQGSYFHSQAYPEGCPQHPSYAQGHGAIAGACATILKAAFNGGVQFDTLNNAAIKVASEDGLSLVPYTGPDANQITVNGEIDKLASNIGLGRNFAGVHWRTDYSEGLKLGEAVATGILRDQKDVYGEEFSGFAITKFDGTAITV
jgi:hypothetical protein